MKKILSLCLALVMLLSCCSALAEVAFNDPAAVKPETIGEYPVTGLSWSATTEVKANESLVLLGSPPDTVHSQPSCGFLCISDNADSTVL